MRFVSCFFLMIFTLVGVLHSCESMAEESLSYPQPANQIDDEIDVLLSSSEECLFTGSFRDALTYVERAERLLPLTRDENDHRKLRSMFNKAVIVTCIEGRSENSYSQFAKFNKLLASKNCNNTSGKSQPNLFDQNGHWPIIGNAPVSVEECLERVDTTEKSLEIACAGLSVNSATRVIIASAIYVIAKQARQCCTQYGFWKTCIQPVVDTWKKAELLGIPPDPYWD